MQRRVSDVIIAMTSFYNASSNTDVLFLLLLPFPLLCTGLSLFHPRSLYLPLTSVAMALKFGTKWTITRLVYEISLRSFHSS